MKNIKKIIAVLLAVITVAFAFAACSGGSKDSGASSDTKTAAAASDYDAVVKKGKLVVGITVYEPMDYKDKKTGKWTGFDADLATAVAQKMGVDVEFITINWDSRFTELKSGTIDCIWNGMTIDDSVKANCSLSKPYATNSQVVVMKKDKLDKYKDTASMKDLAFAVEKGSAGEKEAKKISSNVLSVDAQADAIKEVKAGTSDACIIDSTMANSLTADGKDFDDLGYKVSLTTEEYGIGFRQDSDMPEKINSFLDELKKDGTMSQLSKKYGVNLAE